LHSHQASRIRVLNAQCTKLKCDKVAIPATRLHLSNGGCGAGGLPNLSIGAASPPGGQDAKAG
jgi:hypothetical protein